MSLCRSREDELQAYRCDGSLTCEHAIREQNQDRQTSSMLLAVWWCFLLLLTSMQHGKQGHCRARGPAPSIPSCKSAIDYRAILTSLRLDRRRGFSQLSRCIWRARKCAGRVSGDPLCAIDAGASHTTVTVKFRRSPIITASIALCIALW